jgi:hypothetical protein
VKVEIYQTTPWERWQGSIAAVRMKTLLFVSLCFFCFPALAQTSPDEALFKRSPELRAYFQPNGLFLVLDASPMIGTFKRYRFFVGDEITYKLKGLRGRQRETISAITDSSFTFTFFNTITNEAQPTEIKLNDVRQIRIYRRIPWVSQGAYLLPAAGLIFTLSDVFVFRTGAGGLPNGVETNFNWSGPAIGAGIASLGLLCKRASFPKYRLGKRHRLHVLRVR